jgi:hypothetical protein
MIGSGRAIPPLPNSDYLAFRAGGRGQRRRGLINNGDIELIGRDGSRVIRLAAVATMSALRRVSAGQRTLKRTTAQGCLVPRADLVQTSFMRRPCDRSDARCQEACPAAIRAVANSCGRVPPEGRRQVAMMGKRDYASFTDRRKEFHRKKRADNSITGACPSAARTTYSLMSVHFHSEIAFLRPDGPPRTSYG